MSLDAMVWALNDAPTDGPLERVVLIYLANAATPDGLVSAPGWQQIAEQAGVSLEAVEMSVGRMVRRGLVDQEAGFWTLNMPGVIGLPVVTSERKDRIRPEDRAFIYERDGHACLRCGVRRPLSIDHVIPESLGGPSARSNYQTLCRSCNAWKGVRTGVEFDYRTEVSS